MAPGASIQKKTKEEQYPGISITESHAYMNESRKNFSVIHISIQTLDALWLCKKGHVRIHGIHDANNWDLKFVVA
jgi:hypothetical protein